MSRIDDLRKNAPGPVISPTEGGCWFCHRQTEGMSFTFEFDAFVHENCVTLALEDDPLHAEALFIAHELELIDADEFGRRIADALGGDTAEDDLSVRIAESGLIELDEEGGETP